MNFGINKICSFVKCCLFIQCLFFIECSNTPKINYVEPSIGEGEPGPVASMVVVKFANNEEFNRIIVQHKLKDYNSISGYFEYITDGELTLNCWENSYNQLISLFPQEINALEQNANILGSSPYIPLIDNYYLVDWKWQQILPLSAICDRGTDKHFNEHINKHIFRTNLEWSELTSFYQTWNASDYTKQVDIEEIYCIPFKRVDILYNDIKTMFPFVYYYYWTGLVTDLYKYGEEKGTDAYNNYINYCDSIQNIYKYRFIELIKNNELPKIVK